MTEIPRVFVVDDHQLTVPLPKAAADALRQWEVEKHDEIVAVLAPFGLHPYEMPATEYRRFVTVRDAEMLQEQIDSERGEIAERERISAWLKSSGVKFVSPGLVAAARRLAGAGVVEVPND